MLVVDEGVRVAYSKGRKIRKAMDRLAAAKG